MQSYIYVHYSHPRERFLFSMKDRDGVIVVKSTQTVRLYESEFKVE